MVNSLWPYDQSSMQPADRNWVRGEATSHAEFLRVIVGAAGAERQTKLR
jgi:hypothetical protein